MISTISQFTRQLLRWYDAHRRSLPWRVTAGLPDAYHVFISESMLQQTQVQTVIPYFLRFIKQWPTLLALSEADEQQVLRQWQGLGYYSRARNLLAAARQIVADHDGQIPRDAESLMRLPGVGQYTAGAISSLAYDQKAPILDGNVVRVLCRLDCVTTDPRETLTRATLWKRAAEIVPHKRAGDFNSALMELGATVCTPRSPQCLICPVQAHCEAFAAGVQETIPPPKKRKESPKVRRWTFCINRQTGDRTEWLIEQRPAKGRWAGLWQFITIPADESSVTPQLIRKATGLAVSQPKHLGMIEHTLTHRRYQFDAYQCAAKSGKTSSDVNRIWVSLSALSEYPFSNPQIRISEMLKTGE